MADLSRPLKKTGEIQKRRKLQAKPSIKASSTSESNFDG